VVGEILGDSENVGVKAGTQSLVREALKVMHF
jgi:hypothetical protein